MSMINCPECNKEISDMAKVCPGCGMPVFKMKHEKANAKEDKQFKPNILAVAAIGISIIALIMSFGNSTEAAEYDEECLDCEYEDCTDCDYDDCSECENKNIANGKIQEFKLSDGRIVVCDSATGICTLVDEDDKGDVLDKKDGKEDKKDKEKTVTEFDVEAAKDIECTLASGEKFVLSKNKDKVVLVNFWATWCGYCTEEMPDIQKLYDEYKDSEDVEIVAINSGEDTNTVHRYVTTNGYTLPVGYDAEGTISNDYDIESLPYTFIVNKDGNIVSIFDGATNYDELKKAIEEVR